MYAKCGALRKAQEAFDGLSIQNIASWNALIAGYAQNKHDKEAFTCFERMQNEQVSPDIVTFSCILKACGSLGAVDRGHYIHAKVVKEGLLEQSQSVGNALVDMYVKCGMLGKAQEVFDEIPSHDVISWTALIMGHALRGHGEEALQLYGRMQEAGFLPNAVTFLGVLKACSSLQAACDGQVVHAEIVNDGLLEKDLVVGNALVDMYSKCGMMEEAKDVFDELSVQDSVLWSTFIDGYAQNMQGHRALKCFEQMQVAGFCPDEITLASVIKACGDLAALDIGERLHNQMAKGKPLEVDPIVSDALVGMYSKCGFYEEAQEVFSEMPNRDVDAWNALISGYGARGKWEEAIKSFERMENEGLCPDTVTSISVFKACGSVGALNKGQTLHARVLREGLLEKGSLIANALVHMYGKCGLLEKAKDVFHQLGVRDCATWNSLFAGHIQGIHGDEALNYFQQMQVEGVCADGITFACALKAYAGTGALDKGQEIYNQILKEGLMEKSLLISNSIIDMYAKCGLLEKAQEMFEKIAIPDLCSWNTLIAGYSQHGLGEQALKCFEKMQMAGFSPDSITLVCVLKACGSMGAIQKGEEVHAEIEKAKWLEKDVHVGTALMDMYAKCGLIEKARGVFDKLSCHDVVTWNVLMSGYVHQSFADDVLNFYEQMQAEGITPDEVSFVCLAKACGILGATCKSLELHSEITKRGLLDKDSPIGNATVDMYASCGLLLEARETFNGLLVRDVVSWNSVIAGYALIGQDLSCFSLLHEMVKKGCSPDLVTFTTILNACSHLGQLDKGQTLFELMALEFGLNPTLKHLTCIVDLFARAGQLPKAAVVIQNLPFCVDFAICHALLGASHNLRDAKFAMWAFQRATQSDLNEALMLAPFSNIHSTDYMQENQVMLNTTLLQQSLMQPGNSWWHDDYHATMPIFIDEMSGSAAGESVLAEEASFA